MRESATEFPRTGVARCFGFYFSPNSFLAFSVTVQRYTTRQSTSIFLSGCHSPMSNSWETIAGTHFQVLEKLGAQLEVDVRQEVERHDGGIVEVGIEQVLLDEPHAVGDAGLACILLGFFDSVGVDVDAGAAGDAELLGGHDHDAAVTASEAAALS